MLNLKNKTNWKRMLNLVLCFKLHYIFSRGPNMKLPDSKVNLVKINVIALPLNKWKEKKITLNLDFNILRSSMIQ